MANLHVTQYSTGVMPSYTGGSVFVAGETWGSGAGQLNANDILF